MSKLDANQIKFIEEFFNFMIEDDPEAFGGVPQMAGPLSFYSDYPALSIPYLISKNLIELNPETNNFLFDSWAEICNSIEIDVNHNFKSLNEFFKRCEKYF